MKIHIGILDTRHFNFITTGRDKGECELNMYLAWKKHCKQCDMKNNWDEFEDSVRYDEMELGQTLKDGEVI